MLRWNHSSSHLGLRLPLNDTAYDSYRLYDLLNQLREFDPSTEEELQRAYDNLRSLRQEIVSASRSNFILEQELDTIDDKIRLLVRNRISLQEVITSVQALGRKTTGLLDPKKRSVYEHVLYTLQTEPIHFARLSRLITAGQIQSFVQTVVFDFYGDQYDTRDERLLLSLFGHMLQAEFTAAPSMGSLLRANTPVTNMLSAYSRRGMGLSILSDILSEPLQRITSEEDLDLELNPVVIYRQLQESDPSLGESSGVQIGELTSKECFEIPEIQTLINTRRLRLITFANELLFRICDSVQTIPYGMRWICRKIKELACEHFPEADKRKVGSLIGGYIYLRFFNPVIVTPDVVDIIPRKLSKKMRRNLILIAKLLQNLSNGLDFGEKEPYMIPCNEFIANSKETLETYFDQLVDVHDLHTELVVDKWLERTSKRDIQIQISFNQLFLLHSLLEQHVDLLCGDDHVHLRKQIQLLGPAPAQLKPQDNHIVGIELRPTVSDFEVDAANVSPRNAFRSTEVEPNPLLDHEDGHPLCQDAARLLIQFVSIIPPHITDHQSFREILQHASEYAESTRNHLIAESVHNLSDLILILKRLKLIPLSIFFNDPNDAFVESVYHNVSSRANHLDAVLKRRALVAKVASTILNHQQYLGNRLSLYRQYLENVRLGQTTSNGGRLDFNKRPGLPLQAYMCFKISHLDLESSGVIIAMDPDIKKSISKKDAFTFSATANPNQFTMAVHSNKSRSPVSPVLLDLEELLNMQFNSQTTINIPNMVLNVNLLINLLNTRFLLARR